MTSDDTVIISGLGGENITVLRSGLLKARCARWLILQPQTYDEVLRRFLYDVGLIPLDEIAILDRRHRILLSFAIRQYRFNLCRPALFLSCISDIIFLIKFSVLSTVVRCRAV